jgi:hypothetical protein
MPLPQFILEIDQHGLVQRISKIIVTAQPNGVLIDFSTNVPTVPVVEIFEEQRFPDGTLSFNFPAGIAFDFLDAALGNLFTVHHAHVANLQQEKAYSYRITAGDGAPPGGDSGWHLQYRKPHG